MGACVEEQQRRFFPVLAVGGDPNARAAAVESDARDDCQVNCCRRKAFLRATAQLSGGLKNAVGTGRELIERLQVKQPERSPVAVRNRDLLTACQHCRQCLACANFATDVEIPKHRRGGSVFRQCEQTRDDKVAYLIFVRLRCPAVERCAAEFSLDGCQSLQGSMKV